MYTDYEDLTQQYDKLVNENDELRDENIELRRKIDYYVDFMNDMRDVISKAQAILNHFGF